MRCLNHMPKLSERGVAHLFLLLLLVAGLIVGVYLIQKGPLNFLPKAGGSRPVGPETSFTLAGPGGCTVWWSCLLSGGQHAPQEEFAVKLYARSDIETANLFTAKMIFPKDIVTVKEIQTNDSFIKNWVENFYDNNTGEISLVGGVPSPGYQTRIDGPSGLMAIIIFRAKALGKGTVSFTDSSAILSNLNNINILTVKRGYEISVEVKPSPTPISAPIPNSVGATIVPDSVKVVSSINSTQPGFKIIATVNNLNFYLILPNEFINKISYVYTRGLMQKDEVRPVYIKVEPFTAPGVYKGTGILRNGDNNQQITFPIEVTVSSPTSSSPTPVPKPKGDGNQDGKINLIDMSVIHTDWGKTKQMANFRAGIDMNDDGLINTFDYSLHRKLLLELGVIKGGLAGACSHASPPAGCHYEGPDIYPACEVRLVCETP